MGDHHYRTKADFNRRHPYYKGTAEDYAAKHYENYRGEEKDLLPSGNHIKGRKPTFDKKSARGVAYDQYEKLKKPLATAQNMYDGRHRTAEEEYADLSKSEQQYYANMGSLKPKHHQSLYVPALNVRETAYREAEARDNFFTDFDEPYHNKDDYNGHIAQARLLYGHSETYRDKARVHDQYRGSPDYAQSLISAPQTSSRADPGQGYSGSSSRGRSQSIYVPQENRWTVSGGGNSGGYGNSSSRGHSGSYSDSGNDPNPSGYRNQGNYGNSSGHRNSGYSNSSSRHGNTRSDYPQPSGYRSGSGGYNHGGSSSRSARDGYDDTPYYEYER